MKKTFLGVVLPMLALFILAFLSGGCYGSTSSRSSSSKKINANVQFSATQIRITNNDSFDWTNVKMQINYKYIYRDISTFKAGTTSTINMTEFVDSSSNRFNPFTMKAQDFMVWGNEGSSEFSLSIN
jgi:hypothetical protein